MTGHNRSSFYRTKVAAVSGAAAVSLFAAGIVTLAGSAQAADAVPLGTTESFAILAGTGITNTGVTTVDGDIGTFPNPSVPEDGSLVQTNGVVHAADTVAEIAKEDLVAAYNATAAQPNPNAITADLGGQTLKSGVYNSASSISLNGSVPLTLDAEGDKDAVFVFQAGSTLITGPGSTVALVGEAQACNVYWQVGSSATLNTTTTFVGNIFAMESIGLQTGARVDGRVLARDGAVTLDSNTITRSACDRSVEPTDEPTDEPTGEPTDEPTDEPTGEPTGEPTDEPTGEPTDEPTDEPTGEPTSEPTDDGPDAPPTGGLPANNPPVNNPPVDNPPVDSPPVDSPPVDSPPVDSPPVNSPPISPPVDSPPSGLPGGPPADGYTPPPADQVKTPPKGSVDAGSFARG